MKLQDVSLSLVAHNQDQEYLKLEFEFFQNFESPHTRKSYKNDIKSFLEFFKGTFKVPSILDCEKFHIVAYKEWLTNNDYSPKSINRKISSLSTYFNFLIEKNFLKINPCQGIKKPRQVVKTETNDLTDEEVVTLFEVVNEKASPLHKAIIYLFFSTGIRKSELIELKLKDYKEINGHMTIQVVAKGGKTLIKFLLPECVEVIEQYVTYMKDANREIHPEDWLFQPSKNPTEKKANLIKPLRPKSIDYIFSKYCKLAQIDKRISPHSARATYIGSAIQNGADIIKVSKDVGHSSIRTTEEYNKRRSRLEDSPAHSLGFFKKTS